MVDRRDDQRSNYKTPKCNDNADDPTPERLRIIIAIANGGQRNDDIPDASLIVVEELTGFCCVSDGFGYFQLVGKNEDGNGKRAYNNSIRLLMHQRLHHKHTRHFAISVFAESLGAGRLELGKIEGILEWLIKSFKQREH